MIENGTVGITTQFLIRDPDTNETFVRQSEDIGETETQQIRALIQQFLKRPDDEGETQ